MKFSLMLLCVISSLALSFPQQVMASSAFTSDLKSFTGEIISLDKNKITHLVFIDLWKSYEGDGDEVMVAALPDIFLQQSQQIWLQPEFNVTKAQLLAYQQAYPQVKPLILDSGFDLMQSFGVWGSHYHILLKGGKRIFSGSARALQAYIVKEWLCCS